MTRHEPGIDAIQEVRAGAPTFEEFYRREFPSLVALATAMVGRWAEDVAQEAMVRAHERWAVVSTLDRPGAWVRRVAINLATSRLRRAARETKALVRLRGEVGAVELPDHDDELLAAVARLPGNQRAAIALHYLEDEPVAGIAEILGCSPSTARVHLHRGRTALAAALGGPDHTRGDR